MYMTWCRCCIVLCRHTLNILVISELFCILTKQHIKSVPATILTIPSVWMVAAVGGGGDGGSNWEGGSLPGTLEPVSSLLLTASIIRNTNSSNEHRTYKTLRRETSHSKTLLFLWDLCIISLKGSVYSYADSLVFLLYSQKGANIMTPNLLLHPLSLCSYRNLGGMVGKGDVLELCHTSIRTFRESMLVA